MSKFKTAQLWKNAVRKTSEMMIKDNEFECSKITHRPTLGYVAMGTKREKELKAKSSELEDLKNKYRTEFDEKTKLQQQVDGLVSTQTSSSNKLQHYIETNERLRVDVKRKTDEIEKLQGNVRFMEDRIRNLEIRASEVEKAELTLESTRKQLENTQAECRSKDGEVRRMRSKLEDAEKQIGFASEKHKELESKITDMRYQIRQELIKNESIEKGLESIPHLQEEISEQKHQIVELEKDLADKTALLTASKQAIREYKDQIREANERVIENEELQEDLSLAQHEIDTLKNLMRGKDTVMIQKLQALEQAKSILHKSKQGEKTEDIIKLKSSIDKLSKLLRTDNSYESSKRHNVTSSMTTRSKSCTLQQSRCITNGQVNNIDVNRKPFSLDNKDTQSQLYDHKRPVTAIVYPNVRPSTTAASPGRNRQYASSEFHSGLTTDRRNNNKSPRHDRHIFDCSLFTNTKNRTESCDSESESANSEKPEVVTKNTRFQKEAVENLSTKEKDEILASMINVGDRVKISVPQKPAQYGRIKKLNPLNYSGIVKYKGYFDKPIHDARLMVGVRLDEPNGDTDGVINGKSFMYTPLNQGKYFKIRDVTSIFDKTTGMYISTDILMVQYVSKHLQSTDEEQNEEQYEYSDTSDSNS